MNVVISSFIAPIAYILFFLFMKFSLRNQKDQDQDQDWSTWIARAVSSILCFFVVFGIMINNKSPEKV